MSQNWSCPNCKNTVFEVSPEFDFETNFIEPICSSCASPLSKHEIIRQAEEIAKKALIAAMKKGGFTMK